MSLLLPRMVERARRLIAHSAAFIAATGAASEEDAYTRFTYKNDFPNPQGDLTYAPFAVISFPLGVASKSIATGGMGPERIKTGAVEVCYLQRLGAPAEGDPPSADAFLLTASKIMDEMAENFQNEALPEDAALVAMLSVDEQDTYLVFDDLTTEYDVEREAYRTREKANDFMDVGWRLSLPGAGGGSE